MLKTSAGSHPLHIAISVPSAAASRIGVVNQSLHHVSNGFKTTVRVRRESRYLVAVVHAPAVFYYKVIPDVPASQRGIRAHFVVCLWIKIEVVHTKQKGIRITSYNVCYTKLLRSI